MNSIHQLQELQLIQCSLLSDEHFVLNLTPDETAVWTSLLDAYAAGDLTDAGDISLPSSQISFQIKLDDARVWFEFNLPHGYPEDMDHKPTISVKGENITREEQERWQFIVQTKLADFNSSETQFPIYELISTHLLPLLRADREKTTSAQLELTNAVSSRQPPEAHVVPHYHALLTSHHLKAPSKRRSLQQWSSELSISGFAKVGYPGVIYAEGAQDNIEDFVANIKAMQWLALRVRFVEPVEPTGRAEEISFPRWIELEKIGEVVEEMRKRGKEQYVVEMGIGSAASLR
ncbi:hypothetical protein BJ138DRAFT_1006189 [Hygrophoropsis aurantiaca]|uniref:Uncharacterized protein n=1 Tax=Hygrophoropsis aurantiaca TaxID=72124 RepID=A0ACB8AEN7_9AGAM|nr:hypothetical protein BJ138DRAFT_1006189 [Hygrophoropsis aurantiaca]